MEFFPTCSLRRELGQREWGLGRGVTFAISVGYGEFHPFAGNSTAEGRTKNRRFIVKYDFDQGVFKLWRAGATKPVVEVPVSALNFFPGFFILTGVLERLRENAPRS